MSAVIAWFYGNRGSLSGKGRGWIGGIIIDLVMGIPHILLLILISFAAGKGFWGVMVGISLTHWTSLARLLRAEVMQLKERQYIKIAGKAGNG